MRIDKVGKLYLCHLVNVSDPGRMPHEALSIVTDAYYEKRQVGVTRMYAAAGANQQIDLLVRVFNSEYADDNALYVVFMVNNEPVQYRVEQSQEIIEESAVDLTLVRLENYYDVIGN